MEDTSQKKPRNPRRTKSAVDDAIRKAAEKEILENGFSESLVSNIIKKAKIEARVFYLRYKDLNEFYDGFVKGYDYWFSDLFKDADLEEVSARSLELIFNRLLSSLNESSVMLELLRWEVANGNPTTDRTAMLRELHTLRLTGAYEHAFKESDVDVVAISSLVIAGIYYMSLHKNRSPFCGIDLNKEEDRKRLSNVLGWMADKLFALRSESIRMKVIAERLRQRGVSEEIISECLK